MTVKETAAFLGQIEGVETSVTIRELAEGGCKLSVRTSGGLNATKVCARLGGGGHAAAAGCTVSGTLAEAEADISDMLKDASASYAGDPEAMRLRTMHLAYESVKQSGGTLVIPSAFSEGFTDPDAAEAVAKAAKQG